MKKLLLSGITALFLATGMAHTARAHETLDEIVLNALVTSGRLPYPQDVAGAVHYAPGAYSYPAALTSDDEWALRTFLSPTMAPPEQFDHPCDGDLYVVDTLSPTDLYARCQHHAAMGCAYAHDHWCLIFIQ